MTERSRGLFGRDRELTEADTAWVDAAAANLPAGPGVTQRIGTVALARGPAVVG